MQDIMEQLYLQDAMKNIQDDKIRFISIEHTVLTDAPFIGARICAIKCSNNCPKCFNQDLNGSTYRVSTTKEIIKEVQAHKLNQGIILGGLEWSEQPEEMLSLIVYGLFVGLKIIIYTHHNIDTFLKKFPYLRGHDILVKCGEYKKDLPQYYDKNYDVVLAYKNQKIYPLNEYLFMQ